MNTAAFQQPDTNPYRQSAEEALAALATEAELELTEDEARARLERYGRNELALLFSRYFPGDAINPTDDDVPVQILTSGPDSQWAAIRKLYAFMIVSAQRRVYVQSPFFIPDKTLAEALVTAALSGIDIEAMVSARPSGNRLPDWARNMSPKSFTWIKFVNMIPRSWSSASRRFHGTLQ